MNGQPKIELSPTGMAALEYAERGWRVIPLHCDRNGICSCRDKKKCETPGKHPRIKDIFSNATVDPKIVGQHWTKWSDANIGVVTGQASRIFVLDIDPDKGGDEALASLFAEHGELPETLKAKSGGGGRHYYFRHPGGKIANSASKIGKGLDIRGDGGYIVAAPSNHISGGNYEWLNGCDIAEAPDWLLDLLVAPASHTTADHSIGSGEALHGVPKGRRDIALFTLVCRLFSAGVPIDVAFRLVTDAAANCDPPFPVEIAQEKVRRIYQTYDPKFEPTDSGNAAFFARLYGDYVRFDFRQGKWLIWADHRWRPDNDGEINRLARKAMTILYHQAGKDE